MEKVKENLYKINTNQYLKINKKGNGNIIAPIKDPITKETNYHNLIFTGGTVWGLVKAILIVLFLLLMLWRYNVEVRDCLVIRANFNPETGCINPSYFNLGAFGSFERNITKIHLGEIYIPAQEGE